MSLICLTLAWLVPYLTRSVVWRFWVSYLIVDSWRKPVCLSHIHCSADRLVLSNSSFSGTIPVKITNLSRMSKSQWLNLCFWYSIILILDDLLLSVGGLYLDNNAFIGTLHTEFGKLTSLGKSRRHWFFCHQLLAKGSVLQRIAATEWQRNYHLDTISSMGFCRQSSVIWDTSVSSWWRRLNCRPQWHCVLTLLAEIFRLSDNKLGGSIPSDFLGSGVTGAYGWEYLGKLCYVAALIASCSFSHAMFLFVEEINLSNNDFTGPFPVFLGGLEHLGKLNDIFVVEVHNRETLTRLRFLRQSQPLSKVHSWPGSSRNHSAQET